VAVALGGEIGLFCGWDRPGGGAVRPPAVVAGETLHAR
jgi:hypothetical protein